MARLPLVNFLPFPTHPHWAQIFWLIMRLRANHIRWEL
jgi:hypothetical protein